jgi:transposase-like protein
MVCQEYNQEVAAVKGSGASEGYACPQPTCASYSITTARVHALVGDGFRGTRERIQTFRCQACGATFSARRDTPLYQLKTPAGRVGQVLTALAEGLDGVAAMRVFGHDHATITRWLARAGHHSARWLRHLSLPHVQLDELCTWVRRPAGALWVRVACAPCTKLVPVLHLGPRTQDAAHTAIHKVTRLLGPSALVAGLLSLPPAACSLTVASGPGQGRSVTTADPSDGGWPDPVLYRLSCTRPMRHQRQKQHCRGCPPRRIHMQQYTQSGSPPQIVRQLLKAGCMVFASWSRLSDTE